LQVTALGLTAAATTLVDVLMLYAPTPSKLHVYP
jgi:hypothetical protein